jgi:hypothetical protein
LVRILTAAKLYHSFVSTDLRQVFRIWRSILIRREQTGLSSGRTIWLAGVIPTVRGSTKRRMACCYHRPWLLTTEIGDVRLGRLRDTDSLFDVIFSSEPSDRQNKVLEPMPHKYMDEGHH